MATVSSFKGLRCWQLAIQLAADIYQLSTELPATDRSGLAANMQQTAVSIPTLLATGHKSGKRVIMLAACRRALDKLNELETLVTISGEIHPSVPSNDIIDQLEDVRRAVEVIIKKLHPANPAVKPV